MSILLGIMWVVLCLAMLLVMGVILLQEGKGGGLAEAFGGAGGETFGVKATGIDRFTAICGGVFMLLAILINIMMRSEGDENLTNPQPDPSIPAFNNPEFPSVPIQNNDPVPPPVTDEGAGDESSGGGEEDTTDDGGGDSESGGGSDKTGDGESNTENNTEGSGDGI